MNYSKLSKKLSKMTIEEVAELRDEYQEDYVFTVLCNSVIADKRNAEIESRIDGYINAYLAKKNTPDGAGTPSQGNETR